MTRAISLVLQIGLVVSSIAAILFALRIILEQILGGSWYWGGAMAAFAGPVAFSLALYLFEHRIPAAPTDRGRAE